MNPQPIFQVQENKPDNASYIETDACTSFAITNSIASQILRMTGVDPNLSPRYVAKLSNTGYPGENPPPNTYGNSVQNVYNAILTYGMVTNDDWPTANITSDDEFFTPIPQDVIQKGRLWLKKWALQPLKSLEAIQVPNALKTAPVVTEIVIGSPTDDPKTGTPHLVCQLTPTTYFDSIWGQPAVKTFQQPPINYSSVIVNFKNMQPIYQQQGSPTLYFAVGSILIPFATDYAIYQQNFANSPVIILNSMQFAQFTVATGLAVKSL